MAVPVATSDLAPLWQAIARTYRVDEAEAVAALRARVRLPPAQRRRIAERALDLARRIRARTQESAGAEAFLRRFALSTREGIVLMCLAEALLRIPDAETADALIRDKLAGTRWDSANEAEGGLLLNATTWGLMLTGRLAAWRDEPGEEPVTLLRRLVARAGEPVVRTAIRQAMKIMAEQFIVGETIDAAIARCGRARTARLPLLLRHARRGRAHRARRGALPRGIRGGDRRRGADRAAPPSSRSAAGHLAQAVGVASPVRGRAARTYRRRARAAPRRRSHSARRRPASRSRSTPEESERLELTLELFAGLARDPRLAGWSGLGLAVQAYQRRAIHVCDWLVALAAATGRRLMVRLVKGAYWDSEIKAAQVLGLDDFPVFTRKSATDVSYIACAQALLAAGPRLFPQFATHNSHTVAAVLECAAGRRDIEFQKLQGMGDALYDTLVPEHGLACRVYAPVGSHRDLLAYLVRRLLENGANSSFVHQVGDPEVPLERLVADPLDALPRPYTAHPRVPKPHDLFANRRNSRGVDLSDGAVLERLVTHIADDRRRAPGTIAAATAAELDAAVRGAAAAWRSWDATPAEDRARCLERAADALEARMDELVSLCVREAGKTLPDAVAEVREAVDFCRYYAARGRIEFAAPVDLPGPTGESNRLGLGGAACSRASAHGTSRLPSSPVRSRRH